MTYTSAQKLLLRYCMDNGYYEINFTGADRLSAVDHNGIRRSIGINLHGDIPKH